jgi:hypothetical protein
MAKEQANHELRELNDQPPTVHAALAQLLEADVLARAAGTRPEEFAVELPSLIHGGSSAAALKWLVSGNLVLHLSAATGLSGRSEAGNRLRFSDDSRFALSATGINLARAAVERSHMTATTKHPKPRWNRRDRELWYAGTLLLRLTKRAENQILILSAFQEQHWQHLIDDPLPRDDVDPQKRLRNALYRLNDGQFEKLLFFSADGSGEGIRWNPIIQEQR